MLNCLSSSIFWNNPNELLDYELFSHLADSFVSDLCESETAEVQSEIALIPENSIIHFNNLRTDLELSLTNAIYEGFGEYIRSLVHHLTQRQLWKIRKSLRFNAVYP